MCRRKCFWFTLAAASLSGQTLRHWSFRTSALQRSLSSGTHIVCHFLPLYWNSGKARQWIARVRVCNGDWLELIKVGRKLLLVWINVYLHMQLLNHVLVEKFPSAGPNLVVGSGAPRVSFVYFSRKSRGSTSGLKKWSKIKDKRVCLQFRCS